MCGIVSIIFFIAIAGINYSTSMEAIRELRTGEIKGYDAEMNERVELYLNENEKDIELNSLTMKPKLIYGGDLTSDPEYWANKALSNYYYKNSIIVVQH